MKSLKKINNPFLNGLPILDLHGFERTYARVKTEEFINDNSILGNKRLVIIHGVGKGILKKEIHNYLSNNKKVKTYKLDNSNIGVTIIELR